MVKRIFFYPLLVVAFFFNQSMQQEDGDGKGEHKELQLQIYNRRSKEAITEDPHVPYHDISSAPINPFGFSFNLVDDMNLPIAVQKGVRSCVKHSIANYVSCSSLSPLFCLFLLLCLVFLLLTMCLKSYFNLSERK